MLIRITLRLGVLLCTLVAVYALVALLLPLIPETGTATQQSNNGTDIPLFIRSNGVHTDLIVPAVTTQRNWHVLTPVTHTKAKDSTLSWVAFGWGDKGFYLETPTWGDLTFSVASKAALGLGSAAFHITHQRLPTKDSQTHVVFITAKDYNNLLHYIDSSLVWKKGALVNIRTNAHYNDNDAFYEARGSYTLFHTCNTWTNQALKVAGAPAALWTITDNGILHHYR
jgi:uncharacterized protein (TIGR02117 family)